MNIKNILPHLVVVILAIFVTACAQSQTAATENNSDNTENKTNTEMSDSNKVVKSDSEWKEVLTDEEYRVLREKGTERAFTGKYDDHFAKGVYVCAACGNKLFESNDKFHSGCGWPSYSLPFSKDAVEEHLDTSYGMVRTEITCSKCGGHLGHVFTDGPEDKGGLRYCINSVSMDFIPAGATDTATRDTVVDSKE